MPKQSQETTNALNKDKLDGVARGLNDLTKAVKENDEHYYLIFVTKEDFKTVRNVVYGLIGVILLAVANAIVNGALKH